MKSSTLLATSGLFILALAACKKTEKVEVKTVETQTQTSAPVVKPVPAIPSGNWIGFDADGVAVSTITVEPGNRMTIVQQDTSTAGAYSIDDSRTPAVLSFIPDESPQTSYTSQTQWIDASTITMTSLVPSIPTVVPAAPPAVPAAAPVEQAPFTGDVPRPVNSGTVLAPSTGDFTAPSVIVTLTFKKQ